MARIERFTSRTDAEMARSVLEANGIAAYVSGDDAGGLHPELPYGIGGTAVVVPDERYAEAVALLDDELGAPADLAELEAAAVASGPAPDGVADTGAGDVEHTDGSRTGLVVGAIAVVLIVVLALLAADALPGLGS